MRIFAAFLACAALGAAQINIQDFSTATGLTLNGSAATAGTALRLTPAVASQGGSAFLSTPQTVIGGFDHVFRFQITTLIGGGADGFCFVLQGDPRFDSALGVVGGQMGYGTTPTSPAGTAIANSLVIEFDTFLNGQDLSGNEISIHTNGPNDNGSEETLSIGRVQSPVNLKGGTVITARVQYIPGTLNVYINNLVTPVLSVPYDLVSGGTHILSNTPVAGLNLLGGTDLIVGFCAATGGSAENHDILSWQSAPFGWQTNSAGATLTIDGALSDGISGPARTRTCVGGPVTFSANSTSVGLGWDVGFQFTGLVPNVLNTPGGQTVNLLIGTPAVSWLFSTGILPNFLTPFPGPLTLPANAPPIPVLIGFQSVHLNPAASDLISISQGAELDTSVGALVNGPTGDDSFSQIVLRGSPLCAPADLFFYGRVYTSMFVNSNGRVSFGAGDTDFSATVAEALGDAPFIGAWVDFNPLGTNAIQARIDTLTGEVVVEYGAPGRLLNYFGTTTGNSFEVRLDTLTSIVSIAALGGLQTGTVTGFLGISGGNSVFATNPGAAVFSGAAGFTSNGTDMIYEFGTFGPGGTTSMNAAGGITSIQFFPNSFGNYDWLAF